MSDMESILAASLHNSGETDLMLFRDSLFDLWALGGCLCVCLDLWGAPASTLSEYVAINWIQIPWP